MGANVELKHVLPQFAISVKDVNFIFVARCDSALFRGAFQTEGFSTCKTFTGIGFSARKKTC